MTLVLVHAAVTLKLAGLSWFVQLVFYPGYMEVGTSEFAEYERQALRRVTRLLTPLMLVEASTAVILAVTAPVGCGRTVARIATAVLAGIWASTVLIQLPLHRALERNGWDLRRIRRLVHTQWIRTIGWTVRAAAALVLVFVAADGGGATLSALCGG